MALNPDAAGRAGRPTRITEDRFFIGRIERGFDFLGYHLTADSLTLAVGTMANFAEHVSRLYEQKQAGPDGLSRLCHPGGWNQVSRDRHAVVPCMSRETARLVRRARQSGRPGAGGITEQPRRPRRIADDSPPMERNGSRRTSEASRCEPPSTAE